MQSQHRSSTDPAFVCACIRGSECMGVLARKGEGIAESSQKVGIPGMDVHITEDHEFMCF